MSGYSKYDDEQGITHFCCGSAEMTPPAKLSEPVRLNQGCVAIVAISECINSGRVTLLTDADLAKMAYHPVITVNTPDWLKCLVIQQQYKSLGR